MSHTDEAQMRGRLPIGEPFDQLEAAIRHEMGADQIELRSPADRENHTDQ